MKTTSANPKVTIYEIAQKAGVSSSTVARVLRGDSKETWKSTARRAERIRKLAKEMGYRANWRAKAFSEKRTWTIGLLNTEEKHFFEGVHTEFVNGFNDTLSNRGYHLLLLKVESDQFADVILGSRLDGCAMFEFLPEPARGVLAESQLPAVLLNCDDDPTLERIIVDDVHGGYQAAQHLIELGHRQLDFYVNVEAQAHASIPDRQLGINAALRDAGLPKLRSHHVSHEEMVARLADPAQRPTGLICYSHHEAIPMLSALQTLNLCVPDEISVLGFNDVYPCDKLSPPLTTISYDAFRLGKVGAQLLLRQIQAPDTIDQPANAYALKHHLTLRASTGVPRAASDVRPIPIESTRKASKLD
ncbi:MAG: LacI family DNA-binding transcriptional regulator [Planctomycetota bacterium]